jgi:hypothetical protein
MPDGFAKLMRSASCCVALLALAAMPAYATWSADGVALSPNSSNYRPSIISDGGTGSIVTWHGGAGSDIFAQRVLASGAPATGWPASGPLTVCSATGLQEFPVAVGDGAGGALIFWQDARNGNNYDVFAQHLDASGQIVSTATSNWGPNGLSIVGATGNQYSPVVVSDGHGGAIIAWQDGRAGAGNYDIYAQRVDGDGNLLWTLSGVPVCVAANDQINPAIIADGAGGAYVAWQDYRKGNEYDLYLQHLTSTGAVSAGWTADGVVACRATNSQYYPALAADGSGGVYMAWQDFRSGSDNHIYAQHFTSGGSLSTGWTADGIPVCQASYSQYYPVVSDDGSGGAFVAWQDARSGAANHVYAQHFASSSPMWVNDGIAITSSPNGQFSPQIVRDGGTGAFIAWYDARSGTNDIYLQQVDGRGNLNTGWDREGLAACVAPNSQQYPTIVASGGGSAILSWQDLRSGSQATAAIYAQQAQGTATAGVGLPDPALARLSAARPNPFHGVATMRLTLPVDAFVSAEVLDVSGRRVSTIAARTMPAGDHDLAWDGRTAGGIAAAPGVYLVRVRFAGFDRTLHVVRLP